MPAASRHSISRKKYAGPLPETAVTTSICASSGTHTVGPHAARIASAVARAAASTPGAAYSAVIPAPINAGRFGMVRTSGTSGPSQRARSCRRMPAATEITSGRSPARCAASPRATAAICCGFTASTTVCTPASAVAASAAVVTL